ncbi:MAG: hypothetical protein RLY14_112 [Planctomycetota bacterium]
MATENTESHSPPTPQSDSAISLQSTLTRWCIRLFVLVWTIVIAIDTLPTAYSPFPPLKYETNNRLRHFGLSQGDWPLFAPNPILVNGVIVAELIDHNRSQHAWSSIDWSQETIWQKFYRFRHMNYLQRVGNNTAACEDLADYAKRVLPNQSYNGPWYPSIQFIEPVPLEPPVIACKLFQYEQRMVIPEDNPLPKQADTIWSTNSKFLVKREYAP